MPLIDQIRRGAKAFRFPVGGPNTGGVNTSLFAGVFPLLPGSRYDYRKEAGPAWLNGTVLSLIQWLTRTWSEAPHVVYRPGTGGVEEPVRPHALTDLLAAPNEWYDASVLWMGTLLSWVVDGNAYWYVERSGAGVPVGLLNIPHFHISPTWSKSGRDYKNGYAYRVDGQTIMLRLDEIVHFQNGQDPANPHKGLSPLAAELRSIATDNEAQAYAGAILRNMGVPGAVISPKDATVDLPPDAARQLKDLWREAVTGDARGQPIVPSLPVEIQNPGFSPEQLALDKLTGACIPRICAAIGIDPMVLGLPSETKTYANLRQAREETYENTLISLQGVLDKQLTRQLMSRMPGAGPDDRLGRDYSEVRVLQEDQDARFKRLAQAVGGPFMTVDEARAELGLAPIAGGDVLYPAPGAGQSGVSGTEGVPALRAAGLRQELSQRWRERRLQAETAGLNGRSSGSS